MEKYEVLLYPKSYRDLDDIYSYIAIDKMELNIAKKQTDRIWDAILSLEDFPSSHQDRLYGRYADKGYKQLIIDNFLVIYKIDENKKQVLVVTIQYAGRDL